MSDLLLTSHVDGVMHFASFIQVGDSVSQPAKYYRNNLCNSLNLLDAQADLGETCGITSICLRYFNAAGATPDSSLAADPSRAISELGWQPQRADLETITANAWRWECHQP